MFISNFLLPTKKLTAFYKPNSRLCHREHLIGVRDFFCCFFFLDQLQTKLLSDDFESKIDFEIEIFRLLFDIDICRCISKKKVHVHNILSFPPKVVEPDDRMHILWAKQFRRERWSGRPNFINMQFFLHFNWNFMPHFFEINTKIFHPSECKWKLKISKICIFMRMSMGKYVFLIFARVRPP
jgi:hypothetical protein